MKIHGYTVHRRNTTNTNSDGTAIAVKHNIQHKLIDDFISDTLAVEIETHTGKVVIATLYQPPARNYLPIPDLLHLFRRNCPVYMIADLNANHPTLGYRHTNTKGRQLHHLIHNRTLQHIGPDFPTFINYRSATTPDIILTNFRTYHNTHIEQGPLTTSDHIPIIFTISTKPIQTPATPRPNYNQANWEQFAEELTISFSTNNLPEHPTLEEIDTEIEDWYTQIHNAIRNNIPTTHYTTLPHPPFSHHTKTLMIRFNAVKQHLQTHGWDIHTYRNYRNLQHSLENTLIEDSNRYWSKTIAETATLYSDPATFWRKIKNLSGSNTPNPHYLLDHNNTKVYTDSGKAQLHKQIWSNIYTEDDDYNGEEETIEEVNNFHRINHQRLTPYHTGDITRLRADNYLTTQISNNEIETIINKLKKTCPGESGINKTILKHIPKEAITRLKNIFNASLSAGYFPDKWKDAVLRLIPKPNKSPHHPSNYRPISLLEVPGKIFERIINKRLRYHLTTNNLYNNNQFGFRTRRGTTHALAIASEAIAQSKGDKGQCHVVLRDIEKAFDKVWHQGLKFKILHLNLPEIYEKLLCDFLDDRKAKIKVNNHTGEHFELHCGVPQGSVISPTLFTIYTHDIPSPNRGTQINYADDVTQIVNYEGPSKGMLNNITQREIEKVNQFERNWKIKTNINKFTIIRLGAKTNDPLIIDEDVYHTQNTGKMLGLTITTTGYNTHIKNRTQQANRTLYKLYRFRDMPIKIKTHLIKTLVLTVLDYPPIPTHTLSKTQLSKLQKVQNKALRFATNQRYPYTMNTIEIHTHTKTEPINIRLHNRAKKIWQRLQEIEHPLYTTLTEKQENITRYNRNFPSSLNIINNQPEPKYH